MEACCLLACSSGLPSACFLTSQDHLPSMTWIWKWFGIRQWRYACPNHSSVEDFSHIACSLGYHPHIHFQTFAFWQPSVRSATPTLTLNYGHVSRSCFYLLPPSRTKVPKISLSVEQRYPFWVVVVSQTNYSLASDCRVVQVLSPFAWISGT